MASEVNTTPRDLKAEVRAALDAGDFKKVEALSKEITRAETAARNAEADARHKALGATTDKVKAIFDIVSDVIAYGNPLTDENKKALLAGMKNLGSTKALNACDGIWYVRDFGEQLSSCRLVKQAPKVKGEGKAPSAGKKFGISTEELLKLYGSEKPEGSELTYQQIFDKAVGENSGNERYSKVRKPLLKLHGLVE